MLRECSKGILAALLIASAVSAGAQSEPVQSFEQAAREESRRQSASEQSPEAAELSALDAAASAVDTPVIHPDAAPARPKRQERESSGDPLTEREQRNWLLTGVQKLEGSYEASLTDEERKQLQERRERLAEPPRFVDHMAALKEKEREAGRDLAEDIEAQFSAESAFRGDALNAADMTSGGMQQYFTAGDAASVLASPSYQNGRGPSQTRSTNSYAVPGIGERPQANPYLPESGSAETNRFLIELDQRPRPLAAPAPVKVEPAPAIVPDPAPAAPEEERRRYRPTKDLDEKYFKDLKRF